MLYEIGSKGLKRIDVPDNHAKNNLPIGTVLHLSGYNEPDFVIVKNLGISKTFPGYGARYLRIKLEDLHQSFSDAYTMKYLEERQDGRIQTYITKKVLPADEMLNIWEKSEAKRKRMEAAQGQAKEKADMLEAEGKKLFEKHIPANAKALIVACLDENDSDSQTDYFAHRSSNLVILGYSTHKRDLFSEMRKHADKIPETKHLKTAPKEAEHREKWSMGDGYYLKSGYRHSSGWRVEKRTYNIFSRNIFSRQYYIAMAERCVF